MFKSILYLIGRRRKVALKTLNEKFAYQKTQIFNIFIGSKAESSELTPIKNCIENDQLDDEKPSNP
jgi:hypothetical protein